jgi:hypothetical protein
MIVNFDKGEIFVKKLKKKWQEINHKAGVVTITHKLFGKQKISVDEIYTFWDDRVGVRIKQQEIYIPIKDVMSYNSNGDKVMVGSNIKKIEIKLSC